MIARYYIHLYQVNYRCYVCIWWKCGAECARN